MEVIIGIGIAAYIIFKLYKDIEKIDNNNRKSA